MDDSDKQQSTPTRVGYTGFCKLFYPLVILIVSGCAHTPPGKMSAYAFIGADKIVGGGETVTERFLRLEERGNPVGSAVSSLLDVLMCPVDFLWTGECGCHGKVWREFEDSDRILSCAELESEKPNSL